MIDAGAEEYYRICDPRSSFPANDNLLPLIVTVQRKSQLTIFLAPCSFFFFYNTANFPDGGVFKRVTCGTPGQFPEGADYGLNFQGKGSAYVVGYFAAGRDTYLGQTVDSHYSS